MTYILILLVYAGPLSHGDSVAVTHVPGFSSLQSCEAAGKTAESMTNNSLKVTRHVCVSTI